MVIARYQLWCFDNYYQSWFTGFQVKSPRWSFSLAINHPQSCSHHKKLCQNKPVWGLSVTFCHFWQQCAAKWIGKNALFQWFNKFLSQTQVELSSIVSMLYNKLSNIFHTEANLFHDLPRHVLRKLCEGVYGWKKNTSKLRNTSLKIEAFKICFSQKGIESCNRVKFDIWGPKRKTFCHQWDKILLFYFNSFTLVEERTKYGMYMKVMPIKPSNWYSQEKINIDWKRKWVVRDSRFLSQGQSYHFVKFTQLPIGRLDHCLSWDYKDYHYSNL